MENPGEHLEQAEQANEAVADPFNRRVTLSIAIVAAFLAAVSMFGQNADNDALLSQGDALRLQSDALRLRSEALQIQGDVIGYRTVATLKSNEAANKWAQYQANNIRGHMYSAFADFAAFQSATSLNDQAPEKIKWWKSKFDEYESKRLPKIKEEAEALTGESNKALAKADAAQAESEKKLALSDVKLEEAVQRRQDSEGAQAKADRFDFGELGLQLGVVLCSLAILTRTRSFWFVGIGTSVLGVLLAASGLFEWFLD